MVWTYYAHYDGGNQQKEKSCRGIERPNFNHELRELNMGEAIDFCISLAECYETIIQTMAEGVFVVNPDGYVVFANQAISELTGQPTDTIIGRRCHDFLACPCKGKNSCVLRTGQDLLHQECHLKHKNGTMIPVLRNAKVKKDDQGQIKGAVETVIDISELKKARQQVKILEQKHQARIKFHTMVGKSQVMQNIFHLVQLAGASKASILITGESGTGKELVADLIHHESGRQAKPLVKVNCSVLSEGLLESELFGHVKGAFSGAVKDKIGRFEAADGGTLFLDEISDISPLVQLKILRFLQEKEFERVGENITRKSDVRIISATNKDLQKLIQEGKFREDLYYRLKVFPIALPPLRDRKEDLPLLVDHFIKKFNHETGKKIQGYSRRAIAALLAYHWPGNVRELENAIEHAFVLRKSGEIRPADLPIEINRGPVKSECIAQDMPANEADPMTDTSSQSVRGPKVTRDELVALLDRFKWNKSKVAQHLNLNRTTVWRLIKRFNIN